ncbi:MAG: hypothetical protein GX594_15415 [Pirellulaceae bacterium]|nr:hypothetical protein [Pirellulaceae bacterium]
MFCRSLPPAVFTAAFLIICSRGYSTEITVERSEGGAVVKIDGRLFTEYLTCSGTKPILWPIIGPTEQPMTRAHPMGDVEGEKKDHPHQRSLWFSHGDVNGVNFWAETGRVGKIEHLEFVKLGGTPATIVARNAWIDPDGKKVCEDTRTLGFGAYDQSRWIDFDITLKATDGPVVFGDTKEGTFGIRVAKSIRVDAGMGGKFVNSRNQVNNDAWGQPAEWIDYHGPVGGRTMGIAVLNHPDSFRYPTYWHVRPYGLLAANPFGASDFSKGQLPGGATTIAPGESIRLRYRVLFHRGDQREGRVAEAFAAFTEATK